MIVAMRKMIAGMIPSASGLSLQNTTFHVSQAWQHPVKDLHFLFVLVFVVSKFVEVAPEEALLFKHAFELYYATVCELVGKN